MSPVEYLREFAKSNPTTAAILSAAIACFAAVAVIVKFGIDLQATIPSVVYVIVVGTVFYLLGRLLDEPLARRAASWCLAVFIVAWIGVFFWSRLHPRNEAVACAVYFWAPCLVTADQIASDTARKPDLSVPQASGFSKDVKAKYKVFIQFSGFDRTTIVSLAQGLTKLGWIVQGANSGGERVDTAAQLAEVRYGDPSARPAAEALAAALNASKISAKEIKAVHLGIIKTDTLEVWIGQ